MMIDNRIFAVIVAGPVVGLTLKYALAFLGFVLGIEPDWYSLSRIGAMAGVMAWAFSPLVFAIDKPFLGHTRIGGDK